MPAMPTEQRTVSASKISFGKVAEVIAQSELAALPFDLLCDSEIL
jgi:hypothetical protein